MFIVTEYAALRKAKFMYKIFNNTAPVYIYLRTSL